MWKVFEKCLNCLESILAIAKMVLNLKVNSEDFSLAVEVSKDNVKVKIHFSILQSFNQIHQPPPHSMPCILCIGFFILCLGYSILVWGSHFDL